MKLTKTKASTDKSKVVKNKKRVVVAVPHPDSGTEFDPVRHTDQPYLLFKDISVFNEAATFFEKHGVYTFAPAGTAEYNSFWDEEEKRCLYGLEVNGVFITGEHYSYLNYCRIEKSLEQKDGTWAKRLGFPDFLSMDYYWFQELLNARLDGQGLCCVKARRKGWSYKNAWGIVWCYNYLPSSRCLLGAYDSKFWENTMKMIKIMIDFINDNTDWAKGQLVTRKDHIKSGYKVKTDEGVEIEKGFLSEIICLSFKDSPEKAVGVSATRMIFEEAGDWPGLLQAYERSYPVFRDGDRFVGMPIIYGTGGNSDKNEDFQTLFYNPEDYGLRKYDNIYDSDIQGDAGWFVDDLWFRFTQEDVITEEGVNLGLAVDPSGNANRRAALYNLEKERVRLRGSDPAAYNTKVTQHPISSKEAFLRHSNNVFPTIELNRVRARLESDIRLKNFGSKGQFIWSEDDKKKVEWREDLTNTLPPPVKHYPHKPNEDVTGSIVIYQHPPEHIPYGMYKIGYDPVAFDSGGSKSLASLYVYKTFNKFDAGYDEIVAEFVGRPDSTDIINEHALQLSLYFGGALIMYENERGDVQSYFKRKGYFHLLQDQPDGVIAKIVPNSKVARIKGCHMSEKIKDAAEKFTLRWLTTKRGLRENGEVIYNMDLLPSVGLVEELIAYNREGNFDRVMSFFQIMLAIEEGLEREIKPKTGDSSAAKQMADYLNTQMEKTFNMYRNGR